MDTQPNAHGVGTAGNGQERMGMPMPPLPAKKSPVPSSGVSVSKPAKDTASTASPESYLSYKSSRGGDAQAVREAMLDPSSWVLKNCRTGQEVKATRFMEALLNERVLWPTSSPQLGPSGAKGWPRRHRNKALPIQRPTLLPHGNGAGNGNDFVYFAPTAPPGCMGPPSPPSLQLSFAGMSSRSPKPAARGRSSLPEGTFSRARSVSTSDSTSSNILCAGEGSGRAFKLSNMSTTQIVPSLHVGGIRAISFSPSGALLATCGVDRRCCVFRVQQQHGAGSEGSSPGTTNIESEGLGFTRRRDSVSMRGRLMDDQPMRVLTGHVDSVDALAWTGDDNGLLTASADGTVRCWNPLEGDRCSRVYEHGGAVTSVAWEPRSAGQQVAGRGRFLTGCLDAKVRLFSLGSSEPEQVVLESRPVTAVAFCSMGKNFAVGCVSGKVVYYRTEGMVSQLAVECRRHGFRHSAAQRTRLATSPVRRLSAGNNNNINGNPNGKMNGDVDGRGRVRRRRDTMGPKAGPRAPAPVEERVTGLCFRPQANGPTLPLPRGENGDNNPDDSNDSDGVGHLLLGSTEKTGDSSQERAPKSSVGAGGEEVWGQQQQQPEELGTAANGEPKGDEDDDATLKHVADLLVSTNDNRSRILVSGEGGEITVGFKLKGHNTEGVLGRHTAARYSEDGEFVISGSTDGNVHVFTRPTTLGRGSSTPRRAVTWSGGGQEGHERAQVSDKTVGVRVALFAPASVVRSLGGASSRVILTGDDEGCFKVFCERNVVVLEGVA